MVKIISWFKLKQAFFISYITMWTHHPYHVMYQYPIHYQWISSHVIYECFLDPFSLWTWPIYPFLDPFAPCAPIISVLTHWSCEYGPLSVSTHFLNQDGPVFFMQTQFLLIQHGHVFILHILPVRIFFSVILGPICLGSMVQLSVGFPPILKSKNYMLFWAI